MSEILHILVVEDNQADIDLIRENLPDAGFVRFQIESVSRLSAALARLKTEGIDLVLLDLGLPDSQGLETFRRLREAAPLTPAIILTGNDDQAAAVAAVREGAQDYLVKGQIGGGRLLAHASLYAVERRRAEHRQLLAAEILGVLNEPGDMTDAINRILTLIKGATGYAAMGIRLRGGDDFPYFIQNGFSDDFLLTENTLAVRDREGGICRDEKDNISLECTCGLVISGETDPMNPLFTPAGSFWTNDSLSLLDLPADQDPRLHPRNRCIQEGFRSIALIPIHANHDIVGLLQINDREKDCFTLDMIRYFEGLVDSIGIALNRKQTEKKLQESLEQLRRAIETTIQVLVLAVESKDPYTAGHQKRTANLARAIATEMGLPSERIEGIRMSGAIHDIGKISLPAEILSKPTQLSAIEFSLIKNHAQMGYDILRNVESSWPLAEIVHQHHERMDGSGYPRNLKGEEILLEARIMAVADAVEAMASYRPYRPALGIDAALEEIEKSKGVLYDRVAVEACLKLIREKGFLLDVDAA